MFNEGEMAAMATFAVLLWQSFLLVLLVPSVVPKEQKEVLLVPSVVLKEQKEVCSSGKVLGCERKCYPSCGVEKDCPEVDKCLKKKCQCPKGKVENSKGECVDPSECTTALVRAKRQTPISNVSFTSDL
ncbi:unnamed protein product [Strongylus vulgaris]|uniref:TIL domain-containing protein n=1 Tax=Strongylus vulgaris TaxID=40348 RepID=A0A3P7L719_STRVU|nr:unnamed protein product [Strongylus vulgaris]